MAEDEKFRWEPALDPDSIVVPGLNTAAPAVDQIEQIDQLITLKLQVSLSALGLPQLILQTLNRKSTVNLLKYSGWLNINFCLRSKGTRMGYNP